MAARAVALAAALTLLLPAAPRAAGRGTDFSLELDSSRHGRVRHLFQGEPEPQGWAGDGFDDADWALPVDFPSGWLAGSMGLPWRSYEPSGRSTGGDRLLVRVPLALPPGLALDRADLELIVDDNAELWVNGRRVHADAESLFLGNQPRSFDLTRALGPCGNVLGLRVSSSRPACIGYKFRLRLAGRQGESQPCGWRSPTATPTRSPTATPSPTPRPRLTATPRPTATVRPTPKPFGALRPPATPRPWPTSAPAKRTTRLPRPPRTPRPPVTAGPVRTSRPARAAPLPTATPSPCPPARPATEGRPRVLAELKSFWMGDGGDDALSPARREGLARPGEALRLDFALTATARVWAEAHGIEGLRAHQSDPAPEAFLDGRYLGPLLAEHGGQWRSPLTLRLGAGEHVLELRNAQMQDAADLRLEDFQALSDPLPASSGPCP